MYLFLLSKLTVNESPVTGKGKLKRINKINKMVRIEIRKYKIRLFQTGDKVRVYFIQDYIEVVSI